MATAKDEGRKYYIYDLSHIELSNISVILDRNEKWKELGSSHLKWSLTKILSFETSRTPTYDMLWEWAQQNATVLDLFKILAEMKQFYAMTFLKNYVSSRYFYLMNEGEKPPEDESPEYGEEPKWKVEEPHKWSSRAYSVEKSSMAKAPFSSAHSSDFGSLKRVPEQDTAYGPAFGNPGCSVTESDISFKEPPTPPQYFRPKMPLDSRNLNRVSEESSLPSKMSEFRRKNSGLSQGDSSKAQVSASVASKKSTRAESIEDNTKVPPNGSEINEERVSDWPSRPTSNRQLSEEKPAPRSSPLSFVCDSILSPTPHKDVVIATENFSPRKILGKGGFGVVYEGYWENIKVAIKRIVKRENPGLTYFEEAKLNQSFVELKTLNKYRHDNIVSLYGYSSTEMELCLIYQYMVNGSLEDRLRRKDGTSPLNWKQRLVIACGCARGIKFLHNCDKRIIHGDIKSANILLDGNMEPKIGDFGLAREGPKAQDTHTLVSKVHGTQPYLPVDYIRDRQLSTKVDIYSFGIVLFELATGLRAYNESKAKHKLLRDLIMESDPATYDSMRDESAGLELIETFMEFINIGRMCASIRKKERPEMLKVLEDLESHQQNMDDKNRSDFRSDGLPDISDLGLTDYSQSEEVSSISVSENESPNCVKESLQTNYGSSGSNINNASAIDNVFMSPNIPNITELRTNDSS